MNKFKIIFPTSSDSIESVIEDEVAGYSFVEKIIMILDRIDCEKNTEIFYEHDNKKKFIEDFKALEELLKIKITIGQYRLEEIINNHIYSNTLKLSNGSENFDYDCHLFNDFADIDKIINESNKSRILNRNDFRHCENHNDYRSHKSPLIGGINGFDNAAKWLSSAIGDSRTNKDILINQDTTNKGFYIRFEDENFNNQFHAYHIIKREGGEYIEDEVELNKLRSRNKGILRAFKLLKYRQSLIKI